nr:12154_t:CDS:2 [Entrophospora candida]
MEEIETEETNKKLKTEDYKIKESFNQRYDDMEGMRNKKSIKEMTNEEFLKQFKNLPEIKELRELLLKYKGIFAVSEEDMEQIPREIAEFSIPLKEGMQPKDMDINPEEKKDIKIQESLKKWLTNQMKAGYIQKVEKGGIVERVEFACNLITVEKKGKDELRHCQNMTRLNECTIDRSQRIGFLEMQLKNAVGYKYYSTMDIRMGFNNIGIKSEDIYKTAFKCIYGIYVQLVMGFGYKDAPTEFQETMERIFKEIIFEDWISIYMDDILVKTNSTREMLQNLEKVFRLMVKGKIKADPSKCEFMKKEVKILGKLVSEKGMRIPDAYLKALEDWKWPEGLESYNGRITWMMDFVQDAQEDMSIIRRVINEEKTGPVDYKEPKEAFERLKEKIRKRVVLGKADYTKIMKLSCDARFYSRSFNNLQKGYSIPRKELMAINEGIEHFYADLRISKEVQILTDSAIAYKLHKNITKGKITKSPKFLPLLIEHIELPKQIIWISRDKNKWSDLMTRIGQEDKKKFENEQIDKIINKEKLEIDQVQDTELYPGGKKIENPRQEKKKRKMMNNQNNEKIEKEKEINNNNQIQEEYNKLRKEIVKQNTEEIKEEFEKLIRLNREIRETDEGETNYEKKIEKIGNLRKQKNLIKREIENQQITFQPEEYEEMKKNLEKYKLMMKQIEKEEKEKEIEQKKKTYQEKKKELKGINQQIMELTNQQDRLIYELRELENEITGKELEKGKEKRQEEVRAETSRREPSPGEIWTKRYEERNQIATNNTYRESRRPIQYGNNWERRGTFGCSNCGETTHAAHQKGLLQLYNKGNNGRKKEDWKNDGWHRPGDYNKIIIKRSEGKLPVLPREIIEEILLHNEKQYDKEGRKEILKYRRLSKEWNERFRKFNDFSLVEKEYCILKEKFKKKQPCLCSIDQNGHLGEKCDYCIKYLKFLNFEEKLIDKFGRKRFEDCTCEYCKKVEEYKKRRKENKKSEDYGTIVNQIMNKQLGYGSWTIREIIENIRYHKTTNSHGRNCRTCNILKERLDEIREKDNQYY